MEQQSGTDIFGRYLRLVRDWDSLGGDSEEPLHDKASSLAQEALHGGLGPHDLVQVHAAAVDCLLSEHRTGDLADLVSRSSSLLLKVMLVYAEAYQHRRGLMATLEQNYRDLEQTRRDLEDSRDELQQKTTQLVQAGKMKALGELSAGLIHEVNQPLNAISIIIQDMLRDLRLQRLEPSSIEPSLGQVVALVNRITEIVRHLQVYTRRRLEGMEMERLDMTVPIEGVFQVLGEQLRIRNIHVVKDLQPGLEVLGDAIQLEQVFMNLIINARDAVERGTSSPPARIVVRCQRAAIEPDLIGDCSTDTVLCEVIDNGLGMPKEVREHLFESFFTTKPPGQGTGLGLSISRQIVEKHGGRILVESSEGRGATFRVLLPAAPAVKATVQ